jgi:glutamate-1-semialdehyde aminotransferase
MPLSVLTGRADVMRLFERDVFFYSTFGGEALSLAAAEATLRELRMRGVPAALDVKGNGLRERYNVMAADVLGPSPFARCVGFGCRTMVTFAPEGLAAGADPLVMKSLVQQELIRRGVLWGGFHNLSAAHTDAQIDHLLDAHRAALRVLRAALERGALREALRGEPVEPVFRRTTDFNVKPKLAAASATPAAPTREEGARAGV